MKIGELATRADVSIETIRFYERKRVLPPPQRCASGYRDYGAGDVRRLQFLRRAKQLGFTLTEIQDLLSLSEDRSDDMEAFSQRARAKLRDVDERIAELQRMRVALESLLEACPGHGDLSSCPILLALSDETP